MKKFSRISLLNIILGVLISTATGWTNAPPGGNNPPGNQTPPPATPVPGNNGALTFTTSTDKITLNWNASTDDVTPQANLTYQVYYSTADNITTVADMEANGTPFGTADAAKVTDTVTGLTVSTPYFFNVLVTDTDSNKSAYSSSSISTKGVYVAGYSIATSGIQIAGYWLNGTVNELTPLVTGKHAKAADLGFSGADLYVAGYSYDASNIWIAGSWKNGTWTTLTHWVTGKSAIPSKLFIDGTDIYASGYSQSTTSTTTAAYWTNGVCNPLPPLDPTLTSVGTSMIVH